MGKSVRCTNCGWKGHSPDLELQAAKAEAAEKKKQNTALTRQLILLEIQEKRRERERDKIRAGIQVDELQVGSDCPFCGQELMVKITVTESERWGYDNTTRRLTCGDAVCNSTWWEETVTRRSNDLPQQIVLAGERREDILCDSCGQNIRNGSMCGCS